MINFQGRVIPVIDLRRRFGLPARELEAEDRFIIAGTAKRVVALIADSVQGVREIDGCELESFLSLEEAKALDGALAKDAG